MAEFRGHKMRLIRRSLLLFYHLLGLVALSVAIFALFFPKRRISSGGKVIVLTPFAIAFDGRVQKSLKKLSQYFKQVELYKPKDAFEGSQNYLDKMPQNVTITPKGYSGSYVYFPFSFDLLTFWSLISNRASTILCHDTNAALMGLLAGRISGKRVVVDFHEWMSETVAISPNGEVTHLPPLKRIIFAFIEAQTLKFADHVITVASTIARGMQDKYKVKRDFMIIKNTGAIAKSVNYQDDKIDLKKTSLNLLYIGQVHFHRNIDKLIKGLEGVQNVRLTVQGTCPPLYQEQLEKLAEKCGLEGQVSFLPPVPPEHVIETIRKADIGVMSCTTFSKNLKLSLPNKVFEYLQAERPFLCEDLPAVKDVLGDVSFVHYFNSDEADSFKKAVQRAQDDPQFLASREQLRTVKEKIFAQDDFDQYESFCDQVNR